jgi:hypothetical protein
VRALLLALQLATAQGSDDFDDSAFEGERGPRVFISAYGGQGWDLGRREEEGDTVPVVGGEVAYAFGFGDLGLAGYGYRFPGGREGWSPVALVRFTNRFQTYRGLDGTFTFGVGAARPDDDWQAWFQLALGVRLDLGPMWLGGELSFEQEDLLRLVAGVGVKF